MQDYEVYNSQKKQNEQRATKRMNKKEIEEENEIERQTRKTERLYKKRQEMESDGRKKFKERKCRQREWGQAEYTHRN